MLQEGLGVRVLACLWLGVQGVRNRNSRNGQQPKKWEENHNDSSKNKINGKKSNNNKISFRIIKITIGIGRV